MNVLLITLCAAAPFIVIGVLMVAEYRRTKAFRDHCKRSLRDFNDLGEAAVAEAKLRKAMNDKVTK